MQNGVQRGKLAKDPPGGLAAVENLAEPTLLGFGQAAVGQRVEERGEFVVLALREGVRRQIRAGGHGRASSASVRVMQSRRLCRMRRSRSESVLRLRPSAAAISPTTACGS